MTNQNLQKAENIVVKAPWSRPSVVRIRAGAAEAAVGAAATDAAFS